MSKIPISHSSLLTLVFSLVFSIAKSFAGTTIPEPYLTPLGQYRSVSATGANSQNDQSEFWHMGNANSTALVSGQNTVTASQVSSIRSTTDGGIAVFFRPSLQLSYNTSNTSDVDPAMAAEAKILSNFHVEGSARYYYFGVHGGYGAISSLSGKDQVFELIGNSEEESFIFESGTLPPGDYVFAASASTWTKGDYLVQAEMNVNLIVIPQSRYPDNFPITVELELNEAIFTAGDIAEVERLSSKGTGNRAIEWKASLKTPAGDAIEIFDLGSDNDLFIEAEVNFGPFVLVEIDENTKKGVYRVASRAIDAITGELLGEDIEYILVR
ncbi:hypothetical protein [Pelagicoccus sp. SDUM812005]|uniref:hypothetical protein n=1 Tax=Pelagicoccus sp. SDUM812005 TaxID=3041257 RepID=UPI00280CF289|nr:hypothetical protein [Pelagicoccus sp. SDUM812005]MDQ8182589.1 hypothetical protein [Pelagicoccus sp. SDUM812005]